MRRSIFVVGVLAAATGFAIAAWHAQAGSRHVAAGGPASHSVVVSGADVSTSSVGTFQRPEVDRSTEHTLGSFRLSTGRVATLETADATGGLTCLLDQLDLQQPGETCLQNGLFARRKVAFSVNSQGGPGRFSEMYVVGLVAPGIDSATLMKTDGSAATLSLNDEGAFVFESPADDLDAGTYPTGFRLYGPSGKLVQTVMFPPAG